MTKVIIVGGVAGGASCAARLRRLDEKAEIIMVERGPYVSYANCGLPYYVSGMIEKESSLLVASEQLFRSQFAIDARTDCEAVSISRKDKLFPNSHAGYYPGAKMLAMKVLFRKSNGRLLGAQALGEDGPAVDKRISALAVALQMRATVYDLEEAELCYAPQFGSAKDAVNFAGMVAADVLRGDMPLAYWDGVDDAFLLDVRQPVELVVENVPGAVNIPLGELRSRLGELPRDREIDVICRSGQRSYYATRVLLAAPYSIGLLLLGMTPACRSCR